jgi:glycosyltransferase involved in cell wall biosynthesis
MDGRGEVAERTQKPAVFVLYRDSALRREALAALPGSPVRYCLFGLDELAGSGFAMSHNLATVGPPAAGERLLGGIANTVIRSAGGWGGDVASVLASRRRIATTDVVFATVDTLGIPLALLRRRRLVARTPVVYASIGLLDRVARIRSDRIRRAYRDAIGAVDAIVAYGAAEADELREWLAPLPARPPVRFLPFGIDTDRVRPEGGPADLDVVCVGGDPQRDYRLLVRVAERTPSRQYAVVTTREHAASELRAAPANVAVETELPFSAALDLLRRARVVALAVRDNEYSGATTVLLQALALAKPVVVSRTRAIAEGYGLVDGETCRLVPPGDAAAFEQGLVDLLDDPVEAAALAARGRRHVQAHLTWRAYVDGLGEILRDVAGAQASA